MQLGSLQSREGSIWLLSLGLAAVFGIFGVDKFIHPLLWVGWMPSWMDGLLGQPMDTWLKFIGASEVFIAVLLAVPTETLRKLGAFLAVFHLLGILSQITIFTPALGFDQVAVRDFGLLGAALALFFLL